MCNVTQTLAVTDAMMGLLESGREQTYSSQYADSQAALDYSQAQARLSAQNAVVDATASRESYQRQAAQEAGRSRAGYGASGLSLESGSILELIGDKSAETQFHSAEFTRKAKQEADKQRLAEEYYGRKKSLLQEQYESERKNSTLLGTYNTWRGALPSLLQLR